MPRKARATACTCAAGTRGDAISARSLKGSELHRRGTACLRARVVLHQLGIGADRLDLAGEQLGEGGVLVAGEDDVDGDVRRNSWPY
jgi:hypothetical protein